jgi:hypothetical protein
VSDQHIASRNNPKNFLTSPSIIAKEGTRLIFRNYIGKDYDKDYFGKTNIFWEGML